MLKLSLPLFGALGVLFTIVIPASASDPFKYISAGESAAAVTDTSKGPAAKIYFNHENFLEEVVARDKTGQVELHTHWNDYISVLAGEAKLTVGGAVVGLNETAPGESRGDNITGGKTFTLHPGDLITIPAGMPHWLQLAPGSKFRYLVFKTRE